MRNILLSLLCVLSLWGGESVIVDTGSAISFTDPSYSVSAPWRAEVLLDNFTIPDGGGSTAINFFTLSGIGFRLQIRGNGYIHIFDLRNTYNSSGGFTECRFNTAGRTSILLRTQRDGITGHLRCELWNVDGSGYEITTRSRASSGSTSSGGSIGTTSSNMNPVHIGFLRVFEDNIPTGSRPPVTAVIGDRDWKFDGNGIASGGGNDINTSSFGFAATNIGVGISAAINKGDSRVWMPFGPLRAGHVNQIVSNSYTMADDTWETNCFWQQIPHADGEPLTSKVVFTDRTDCDTPGIKGLIHGPYKFRLRAFDNEGRTASADQEFGAVAYDDNGVVIYPDERLNTILGPMKVLGSNPWEWVDRQSIVMAQNNWQKYSILGGTWEPEWLLPSVADIPRLGTIYRSSAAPTKVYGTGTNFLPVFCGGEVGPVVGGGTKYIVTYRPFPYVRSVTSCQSDTEITTANWEHGAIPDIDPPGSPYWGTYGFTVAADQGQWIGNANQSNVNFYDNALAHYRLYYASGWHTPHVAARWVADRWMTNPWNMTGNQARDAGFIGMMLRLTIDGGLESMDWDPLPALRLWSKSSWNCVTRAGGSGRISDVRETAYCTIMRAITAMLDPDESERDQAIDNLRTGAQGKWLNWRGPLGNWFDAQANTEPRVSEVAQGSATVTKYSGTDYPSNYCAVFAMDAGSVSVDTDRVTMTGTGTDFTGLNGNYVYLTGTWNGTPWAQVSRILSTSTPTETTATLSIPWRGDHGSIVNYGIIGTPPEGTMNKSIRQYHRVNSSGDRTYIIDQEWYWCKRVNGSEITLDRPYQGDTSGGNVYRMLDGHEGIGLAPSMPFYNGIATYGFHLSAHALANPYPDESDIYRNLLGTTNAYILSSDAYSASAGGIRYVSVSSAACGGDGSVLPMFSCGGSTPNSSRSYWIETFAGMGFGALGGDDNPTVEDIDAAYTKAYARSGFATPFAGDGNYSEAVSEEGYLTNANLGTKNYGQAWGVGGGQTWAAARLGGVTPPSMKTVWIGISFPVAAEDARLRLVSPSGGVGISFCESSPCSISVDTRQGTALLWVEYRDENGKVIAKSSEPMEVN